MANKPRSIMRRSSFLFVLPIIIVMMFYHENSVYAQTPQVTVSTDKSSYYVGDTIKISGKITSPTGANSAVLQIYNKYDILVQIGTITISPSGTYSTTVKAQGETWNNTGTYTIKVIYVSPPDNAVGTKTITVQKQPMTSSNQSHTNTTITTTQSSTQNQTSLDELIKQRIEFAKKLREALDNNTENNTENNVKSQNLTDSNTPNQTQNQTQIPFWVKDTARKWHDGIVDNDSFSNVIQYMISRGVVTSSNKVSPDDTFAHIPSWVKNTAQWWTQGQVSDDTFFDAIQYLLDENVIRK